MLLCDWVLGGGSVDERRLRNSGGKRRKIRLMRRCWWALSSRFCSLPGQRWKWAGGWAGGQMQMGAQQWKSSALLSVSFVFLCTCSVISFSARFRHLSPLLLVSPTLLRSVFLLLCPPAPSLLCSLVSRGASWRNRTCRCVCGGWMELGCWGFSHKEKQNCT